MRKNIKIYLCDFVHNYLDVGSYMFPLNIGYIAAYAKKFFLEETAEIRLFKYPGDFIEQFKIDAPDIVGFSHYTWNADLDNKFSKWVKYISPGTIVVFGGPNINYSLDGYRRFFVTHDSVDFYIPYQGEAPFVNLLRESLNNGLKDCILEHRPIDGVIFYDKDNNLLIQGKKLSHIKDLDNIPSPYLTGLLDEFFDKKLIPIVETNRGCPYTCTFCAQGLSSHNRVDFFNIDRVKDEIRYIADRVKHTNILNLADANFGIAERDIKIAEYIANLRSEKKYPHKFNTNWAKNQPRLFEIAKILTDSVLYISLQSLDETVLKNVKRTNIELSIFKDIMRNINAIGGVGGTEIILGLPGETKESHIQTIKELFDWNVACIICYNALILEGTEMSLDRENNRFGGKTKFRLIDNSFGKYDHMTSFEVEEGIRSTSTMSEEDILYFRPVHWLIQFLWNYRFQFELLKYLQSLEINPLDYILRLIDSVEGPYASEKVKNIFREFRQDAEMEWFDSTEALQSYYSQPEQFKMLEKGSYGKLNGKYIFRVLLEAKEDFEKYLYETAINYAPVCKSQEPVFRDILNFSSNAVIDFTRDWNEISTEKSILCKHDIFRWKNSRYKEEIKRFYCQKSLRHSFYLPERQKQAIETLLKQYGHNNKNATLRKMSEWMDIRDFFYKVEIT